MQLILRTLLRTFQAQIAKKITFGSGSASAKKNDVLKKKKKSALFWLTFEV